MPVKITSLKINKFEDFKNVPEIVFSSEHNILVGGNGAGKTTLLRIIECVANLDFTPIAQQEFDLEAKLELSELSPGQISGPVQLDIGAKNQRIQSPDEITPETATTGINQPAENTTPVRPAPALLQFASNIVATYSDGKAVRINAGSGSTTVTVDNDSMQVQPIPPQFSYQPIFGALVFRNPRSAEQQRYLTRLGVFHSPVMRFSEGVAQFDYLSDKLECTFTQTPFAGGSQMGLNPGTTPETKYYMPVVYQFLLGRIAGSPDLSKPVVLTAQTPTAWANNPGILSVMLNAMDAKEISFQHNIKAQDQRPGANGLIVVTRTQGLRTAVTFSNGRIREGNALTFGQRRFLAMALMVITNTLLPAVIDEIDNGFHHGLLKAMLQILSGRQSFFSSHNTLALDLISFTSKEQLQGTVHRCVRREDGSATVERLQNAEAAEVFRLVSTAAVHPSEVLMGGKLW